MGNSGARAGAGGARAPRLALAAATERGVFPGSALFRRAFTCCNGHGRRRGCCRLFLLTHAAKQLYTEGSLRAYYHTAEVYGRGGCLTLSLRGGRRDDGGGSFSSRPAG